MTNSPEITFQERPSRFNLKKTVLLDLGKLKYLYNGLGQVSYQLGKKLGKYNAPEIDFYYLLPKRFDTVFFNVADRETISLRRRYFPFTCRRYDLWHSTHQDSAYFPSDSQTPYLLTIHDLNFLEEKKERKAMKRLRSLQKKVSRASAITVISKSTEKIVKDNLDLRNIPVHLIYQGVKISRGNEKKPGFAPSKKFLFSIGVILEKKNFIVLLDFMKLLPEYKLVIAGKNTTEYAKLIEKKIQKLNLADSIIMPGIISDQEKTWLYQNCEAFVYPSKYEGFGMPIIEAMNFGKPVFLSTYSCLPEIGSTYAYYWNDFDPKKMSDYFLDNIFKFQKKPELSENMKIYAQSFNWDNTVNAYIKVYKKLLGLS